MNVEESAFKNYYQRSVVNTVYRTNNLELYLAQLVDFVGQYLTSEMVPRRGIKVFPILFLIYEKPMGEETQLTLVNCAFPPFILNNKHEIAPQMEKFAKEITVRNENVLRNQSFLNLAEISHLDLYFATHNPLTTGSTFVELP